MSAGLAPSGSVQDRFALMLHDRVVALEHDVRTLMADPLDPRVTVLGTAARSESGAVFVRVMTAAALDIEAWCEGVLRRLGGTDPSRFDLCCCHHWSLGRDDMPFITEALVERWYSPGGASVARVAHAALDSTLQLRGGAMASKVAVDACAVTNPRWFAESIRTACEWPGTAATLRTWDPKARRMVSSQAVATLDHHAKAWTLLNGWLATHTEVTDVWHPRSLNAASSAVAFVSALGNLMGDAEHMEHMGHMGHMGHMPNPLPNHHD